MVPGASVPSRPTTSQVGTNARPVTIAVSLAQGLQIMSATPASHQVKLRSGEKLTGTAYVALDMLITAYH